MRGLSGGLVLGAVLGVLLVLGTEALKKERGRQYLEGLHAAGLWPEAGWDDGWGDVDPVDMVAGEEAMMARLLANTWVIDRLAEKRKTAAAGPLVRKDPVVKRGPTSYAVFVVGSGDAGWVREEGARLRRLGALGLLVAGTEDEELREAVDELGLVMAAASGAEAAAYLDIGSYPALLDPLWPPERVLWELVEWFR